MREFLLGKGKEGEFYGGRGRMIFPQFILWDWKKVPNCKNSI